MLVHVHVFVLFIHLFIYLFIYSFIYLFIHLFIYSFIYLFIHLFIYSFIYSFTHHLFIYSFIIFISLSVGPSMDSSGINMVDCVRIYMKTKDEFGFPERPITPGLSLAPGGRVLSEDERTDRELLQPSETQRLGQVDRLVY